MGVLYVVAVVAILTVAPILVSLFPTILRIQYGRDTVHRLVPVCLNLC
jgi:cell division protein FtsL